MSIRDHGTVDYRRVPAAIEHLDQDTGGRPSLDDVVDASRAGAVARNREAWLNPCHRALRGEGGAGGYHRGTDRTRAVLARESARSP